MDELRVLRGNPDDHELAALVHALFAVVRSRADRVERRRSWWSLPGPVEARVMPGAWRRSGLPR
ncbi:acyl-CoA carboxylase subunit epsilon [Amycolatopsis sp. OK19-0408]|uniref:Acyl-CoA carboxylase subunit epsilon n=1 Tax=Amycolatopsis iheyensis TaxID=2945988 RepID=A0A9X2SKL4_9PSEU|nr:acyl-CoA carboxylase subunit epsilon [Amycolatopsis iheyensis]MCR6483520.1 acyl-CoA carboxylase subunit epsilon [Amycolatopsis iheyensis]